MGLNPVFDLGKEAAIGQFLVGGTAVEYNNGRFLLPGFEIFVSDDTSDWGEPVYAIHGIDEKGEASNVVGRIITLPEAVKGRYVKIVPDTKNVANTTNAWMSEFAAIGYAADVASPGVQIRNYDANAASQDIRFRFDADVAGLAYKEGTYEAGYAAATVKVGGVDYPVVTMGALVSNKTVKDLELVIGNATAVEAKKLFAVAADSAAFTVVITGVPQTAYGTGIAMRPYIAYNDNGTTKYLYGQVIVRSVQQAIDAING